MAAQTAGARATLASSRWSPGGSQDSDASQDATTGRTTPQEITGCKQTGIIADFKTIATYLVEEGAPEAVQEALSRINDAYKERVDQKTTEQAIRQLQAVVQKLADKVENKSNEPTKPGSYAAAVARHTPYQTRPQQSLNAGHVTPQKPVPTRHKREIVVVQGTETTEQKRRTYKELLEQVNRAGVTSSAVAIHKLATGDMMLTMEDELARTSWLANSKWLETFSPRARVKHREFAVIAHRIRVNQIQGQAQAIKEIYKQNPKLKGIVDIVQVAFTKKLLRSGRAIKPLIISVTKPEQANRLIDASLI
jgi:hypothetical protein